MAKARKKKAGKTVAAEDRADFTNVEMETDGDALTISIDLSQDNGETPKGFRRIATTHGNKPVPEHPTLRIGLFVYDRG